MWAILIKRVIPIRCQLLRKISLEEGERSWQPRVKDKDEVNWVLNLQRPFKKEVDCLHEGRATFLEVNPQFALPTHRLPQHPQFQEE